MSDSLHSQPTNEVIYGGRQNTGVSRTGLLFGNPISSFDINSTQNNLLNVLAQYMTKNIESVASVDLEGWGASTLLNRDTKLYNIKASIYDAERGETYFIYCPNLTLNLPVTKRDQYLKLYYRIVVYTKENRTNYENTEGTEILPRSAQMYKYGYRKSSSTASSEETTTNDIGENQIDSEVSVRLGIQWTLGWETAGDLSNYKEGPVVALYRYFEKDGNDNLELLFNTTRKIAYNDGLTNVPTIYAKSITKNDIVLDGAFDMMMSPNDDSSFKVQVIFDQSFSIGANKNIIIGVKDAPSLSLSYRLLGGTIVSANSMWYVSWKANTSYLMTCTTGELTYFDPATEQLRLLNLRVMQTVVPTTNTTDPTKMVDGTVILSDKQVSGTHPAVWYIYDKNGRWRPKVGITYKIGAWATKPTSKGNISEFDGIDHYFDEKEWRTTIPAGTLVDLPVYLKNGVSTVKTGDRCVIPGTVLCNGAALSVERYSELYKVLGTRFGSYTDSEGNKYFKVPNYSGRYRKSVGTNITSSSYAKGRSSFTLASSNIPKMDVSVSSTTGETAPTASFAGKSKDIKVTINNKTLIANVAKNHYHLSGAVSANVDNTTVPDNGASAVPGITNWPVERVVSTGTYRVTYPSTSTGDLKPTNMGYNSISPSISYYGLTKAGSTGSIGGNAYTMVIASKQAYNTAGPTYGARWALTSLGVLDTGNDWNANTKDYGTTTSNSTAYTPTGTVTVAKHTHTLPKMTVGTSGSSASAVDLNPSYCEVNTYIYLGQSLVIKDEETTQTIESQGNIYASPSLSDELYLAMPGNTEPNNGE